MLFQPADFDINQPPIPQPLPEVPAEAGKAVKKAEFEKVAEAEIEDSAEIRRKPVVQLLILVCPSLDGHPRLALRVPSVLLLPFGKRKK